MDWIGLDPTQKSSPARAPSGANNCDDDDDNDDDDCDDDDCVGSALIESSSPGV